MPVGPIFCPTCQHVFQASQAPRAYSDAGASLDVGTMAASIFDAQKQLVREEYEKAVVALVEEKKREHVNRYKSLVFVVTIWLVQVLLSHY